jgi:DNA-binding transcriptional ArsR family regulator
MDMNTAVSSLEALSHETRLGVFRLLVQAEPAGLSAGEISDRLDVRQNTMSSHLAKLQRARIVTSQRDGRHIIYRADVDAVRDLILYLMEDCCARSAQLCDPITASMRC